MPPSSQEIKERLESTASDRPYQMAQERAASLRGRVGLGRSQTLSPAATMTPPQTDQGGPPSPGRMDFSEPPTPPEPPTAPPDVPAEGERGARNVDRLARDAPAADWPHDVAPQRYGGRYDPRSDPAAMRAATDSEEYRQYQKQSEQATRALLDHPITQEVLRRLGTGASALDTVTIYADAMIPGPGQGLLKDRYDHYTALGLDWDLAANATMRDYDEALGRLAEDPSAPGIARAGAQAARVVGTAESWAAPVPLPGGTSVLGYGLIAGTFRKITARELAKMASHASTLEGVAARLEAIGMKADAAKALDEAKALREAADAAKAAPKKSATSVTGGTATEEELAYDRAHPDQVPGTTPDKYVPRTAEQRAAEGMTRGTVSEGEPLTPPTRGPKPPASTGAAPPEKASIRYPTEENLGIPKADLESMPANIQRLVISMAHDVYDEIQTARGGVVPRSEVDRESERILIDAGILAQTPPRTPVSAPGVVALRRALWKVVGERDAMEEEAVRIGRDKLDEAFIGRYLVKIFEQNSIQRVIAGARAEWGRVGQAWQGGPGDLDRVRLTNTYRQIIKAVGGRDNADAIMERLQAIRNDPLFLGDPYARTAAQLRYVNGISRPNNWAKLREAWTNAILSIPPTHMAYVFGQGVFHEVEALAKLPTAAVDQVVRRVWRSDAAKYGGTYSFNQALAGTAASQLAKGRALIAAWEALRPGGIAPQEARLFEETGRFHTSALVSGKGPLTEKLIGANVPVLSGLAQVVPSGADILRAPTKVIGAYTAAYHELGRTPKVWEMAAAEVEKEMPGGSIFSREFRRRMAIVASEIDNGSRPEMAEEARKAGARASLRDEDPNTLARILRSARDMEVPGSVPLLAGARPLYRVMPFINIGFNIASYGIEYSPLGLMYAVTRTGARRSEAIARAGLGSILWKVFWDKADAGELTGAEPDDPNERALWQREGRQPYSIMLGGEWHPIDRYEPIASTVKWMAGLNAAWKELEADQAKGTPLARALVEVTMGKVLGTMARGYADMSWMTGISQIVRAVNAPDKVAGLDNYFGQQATSQIPFSGLLKRTAQATDPFVRSPRGTVQQIEAAIPGLSPLVPASRDVYGQDVPRRESQQGLRGMLMDPSTKEKPDPVDEELTKHQIPSIDPTQQGTRQIFATMAQKEIASFKLTPEEGTMLQTLAGRATHQQLSDLFSGKQTYQGKKFAELPEPEKIKAIQKTMTDARATARAVVADAILHQATAAPETARAVDMKLSIHASRWERALTLEAVSRMPQWTSQASKLVGERLAAQKGQPTVAQYLRAAPYVRQYLSAPAFDRVPPEQVAALEQQKREHSEFASRDRLDGTKLAEAYLRSHPLLRRYENEPVSAARERVLEQARRQKIDLAAYVGGARYTVIGQ